MIVEARVTDTQCEAHNCTNEALYLISREDGQAFNGPLATGWHSFSVCANCLASYVTAFQAQQYQITWDGEHLIIAEFSSDDVWTLAPKADGTGRGPIT